MERIVVQTKVKTVVNEPPPRPDPLIFTRMIEPPLILSMNNIDEILRQIDEGDREPLNHICLTTQDNEAAKQNNDQKDKWIRDASIFINEVWKRYNDSLKAEEGTEAK